MGKKLDDITEKNISDFEDYFKNIKIPDLKNTSHKEILREMLEKEELKETKQNSPIFKSIFRKPVLRYSLSFSFALIIIFCLSIFLFPVRNKINISLVAEKNVLINGKNFEPLKNIKLKENDLIKTNANTAAKLEFGTSSVQIFESSTFKILNNEMINKKTVNRFFLEKGKIFCQVKLPTKDSVFEIMTENALFTVTGTKFYVEVKDNYDVELNVTEGKVKISKIIRKTEKNSIFNDKISEINDLSAFISKDEKIIVKKTDIDFINNELENIFNEYKKNNDAQELNEKIKNLKSDTAKIFEYNDNNSLNNNISTINIDKNEESEKLKKNFSAKLLNTLTNEEFDENSTGLSAFDNTLFISNDKNKTIYSVDISTGKVNWEFKDKKLKKITSNVYKINDKIIVSSPDSIYVLNSSGKIISCDEIVKGTIYWPENVKHEDKLYIPLSRNILVYSNNTFTSLDNISDSYGQLYITVSNEKIYGFNLNTLDVFSYDLKLHKTDKIIGKLQNRAFMAPVIFNDCLFTADQSGKIYKFYLNGNKENEVITINIPVYNFTENSGNLYFVAGDGYFYKLNTSEFKNPEKIAKVDNDPSGDKYLIKKCFVFNNDIYFSSDTGKIFFYDIEKSLWKFLKISDNIKNNPLVGTPVYSGNHLYFADTKANIYYL